ncbi:hypothetical protein OGM63_10305 [Plectonema radiosum NIES-515]|uniref:Transposase n=1 Tax=Plectonema radiosum NIES-515 TaxID=2986073 RepID=A0ABT3AYV1_9CYAN|nr:hypothetical protein [Plectonema radiosum]MCV3213900.1 hypothetical protein [Plectonema radiosum NIES-515]
MRGCPMTAGADSARDLPTGEPLQIDGTGNHRRRVDSPQRTASLMLFYYFRQIKFKTLSSD